MQIHFCLQADAIVEMIGFPDYLTDINKLDEKYKGVSFIWIININNKYHGSGANIGEATIFIDCACLLKLPAPMPARAKSWL